MATRDPQRARNARLDTRITPEARELIVRAVEVTGTTLSDFAESNLVLAAQRTLADRTSFTLTEHQWAEWEKINDRPARDLPGLRSLLMRAEEARAKW